MSTTQDTIDAYCVDMGIEGVERDALIRFANYTAGGREVDPEDIKHAAALIMGIMQGIRVGDDLNVELRRLFKARKARAKLFDPQHATMGTPAWNVVEHYVRGKISHREAVDLFMNEIQPASRRQIESWIAAIKPRVEETVNFLDGLKPK